MRVLIDLIKLAAVAWLGYSLLRQSFDRIVALQQFDIAAAFAAGASIVYGLSLRIGVLLLTLGVLDYAYQRWQHERDLLMTPREIKDELRQMEGNPEVKRVRRGMLSPLTPNRQGGN
jgi:flagellar biosynthesis protein FlhB